MNHTGFWAPNPGMGQLAVTHGVRTDIKHC